MVLIFGPLLKFLYNCIENFILIWKSELTLFFDQFSINPNGKFSYFTG